MTLQQIDPLYGLKRFKFVETFYKCKRLAFDNGQALFKPSRARNSNHKCERCSHTIFRSQFMWLGIQSATVTGANKIRICGECMSTLEIIEFNFHAKEIEQYEKNDIDIKS